ncbi:uncharacterized protein B0H18DRAFT_1034900 [Fomitopsis serialis]|uniref:uncharacterized protein n=1 Tax=Fomitopsis serialis TaxID=139415 RepID=UPI0020080F59|nr:uncharacterized protein B0H18DRAFT_1034900 [Neoantrodia serialis]KAH9917318.1 hypothetical protein B0H18DRAFT_1034900 [Neoantrodia serialis]
MSFVLRPAARGCMGCIKSAGAFRTSLAQRSVAHAARANASRTVAGQEHATARLSHAQRRWATSTTEQSTTVDPAEVESLQCLEEGTQKLEEGDVQAAKALYQRSVDIKRTASSLFNLGVTHYHLKEYDEAIAAWKESIALQPSSADAHTNLASAYIISPISRPDLALHHLQVAASLQPEDPEIAFNLAAVLEASLVYYKRSKEYGVDRAAMHIRNVSAKILGQKLKAAEAQAQGEPQKGDA